MATLVSSWSDNVETMPADYIMPPEMRPGNFVAVCKDIPVIDLGQQGDYRTADLIQQILKASQEFGIFQVINHGVSDDIIQQAKSLYMELFHMSAEDKDKLYSEDFTKDCRLYTSGLDFTKEDTHLWKDTLMHGCFPLEQHMPSWPEKPARYREVVGRYAVEVRKLGLRILDLMSQGLGLEEGYFEGGELTHNNVMGINYYPPCPDPSLAMGISGHTDPNLITLLQQDVAGLQILKDGQWVGVELIPNAFVVNGGYQLEIVSNGKLKSAEHRAVTNSTDARTSIVTFFGPIRSTVVEPAKEAITSTNPQKYKSFVYGEFQANYLAYIAKKVPHHGTPLDPYKL